MTQESSAPEVMPRRVQKASCHLGSPEHEAATDEGGARLQVPVRAVLLDHGHACRTQLGIVSASWKTPRTSSITSSSSASSGRGSVAVGSRSCWMSVTMWDQQNPVNQASRQPPPHSTASSTAHPRARMLTRTRIRPQRKTPIVRLRHRRPLPRASQLELLRQQQRSWSTSKTVLYVALCTLTARTPRNRPDQESSA